MNLLATPPDVTQSLESFRASLLVRFGARLRELTLFGSRARGDAQEDSDIDVLVVIDDLSERERGEVFDLSWAAAMAAADYVVLAPIPCSTAQATEMRRRERRLMREVDADGIPLWSHP